MNRTNHPNKTYSIALGFLKFAGRFYKWAFKNIFRLVRKSDEHIKAIEERKRSEAARQHISNPQP